MEFSGKKVVVTGAAGIFGRWISEAFLREGAHVCLADMRADVSREIIAAKFFSTCGHVLPEYGASSGTSIPLPVSRPSSLFACGTTMLQ